MSLGMKLAAGFVTKLSEIAFTSGIAYYENEHIAQCREYLAKKKCCH